MASQLCNTREAVACGSNHGASLVAMTLRIADGNELPKSWQPGDPLPGGRFAAVRVVEPRGCPFGSQCFSCRNGLTWDATTVKHTATRNAGRKLNRRAGGRVRMRR